MSVSLALAYLPQCSLWEELGSRDRVQYVFCARLSHPQKQVQHVRGRVFETANRFM